MDLPHAGGEVHPIVRHGGHAHIGAGGQRPALFLDGNALRLTLGFPGGIGHPAQPGNVPILALAELVREPKGIVQHRELPLQHFNVLIR